MMIGTSIMRIERSLWKFVVRELSRTCSEIVVDLQHRQETSHNAHELIGKVVEEAEERHRFNQTLRILLVEYTFFFATD